MDDQRDVLTLLETAFGEASLNGSLHALDIDGVAETRYRSDEVRHSARPCGQRRDWHRCACRSWPPPGGRAATIYPCRIGGRSKIAGPLAGH
jgi:hypothetical protein